MNVFAAQCVCATLVISLLTACGGGGGGSVAPAIAPPVVQGPEPGGQTGSEGPNQPPTADVHFPPANSVTDSDTILVRGIAQDADGDRIVQVSLNGVQATSEDGFATWQASVPLSFGANSLLLEIQDSEGNADPSAASINVFAQPRFLDDAQGGVFDRLNNQYLIIDRLLGAVFAINAQTGERSMVSGDGRGSGPGLPSLVAIALDAEGRCAVVLAGATRCALVINDALPTVIAIDLVTGERAVLSGEDRGEGPELSLVQSIYLDPETDCSVVLPSAAQCALVTDRDLGALFAVDLDTGDRAIISAPSRGAGPAFVNPRTVVLDPGNVCEQVLSGAVQCALVINTAGSSVFAVDLANGNRALLSGAGRGVGPGLDFPQAIVLDAGNRCVSVLPETTRCAWVLDGRNSTPAKLLAVDLVSGNRATLSDEGRGSGPAFGFPDSILIEGAGGRAVVVDRSYDALLAVNLTSGDRELFPDHRIGDGPGFGSPLMLTQAEPDVCNQVLDNVLHCALVTDTEETAVVAVDLDSGNRAVIASNERGAGPDLIVPHSMVVADGALCNAVFAGVTRCAILVDAALRAILAVDLQFGDRMILSDGVIGSGPEFSFPSAIALSADCVDAPHCALILDSNQAALFAVNLESGARVILSDERNGSGPNFQLPTTVAAIGECNGVLPAGAPCALVADAEAGALLAVDLASGHRTVVSDDDEGAVRRGNGPQLDIPVAVVVADSGRCEKLFGDRRQCALVTNITGAEGSEGSLMAVDIETGNRVLLFNDHIGNGPTLPAGFSFILDREREIAIFTDQNFDALSLLDLQAGARVVTAWEGKKDSPRPFFD